MGKEWRRGGGYTKASRSWRTLLGRGKMEDGCRDSEASRLPVGCMRSVFRLLEFPLGFHLGKHVRSRSSSNFFRDVHARQGDVAPMNSLKVDRRSSFRSKDECLEIQRHPGRIKIKTSIGDHKRAAAASHGGRPPPSSSEPDNPNSPSCRTPNLVARLMGLDGSPSSLSVSTVSCSRRHRRAVASASRQFHLQGYYLEHDSDIPGVRSLPETPRVSTRKSDVDHHQRLSLQINKENMTQREEIVLARVSDALKKKKSNLGLKENVDAQRQFGMDITNKLNASRSSEFHDISKSGRSSSAGSSPKLMNLDLNAILTRSKVHNNYPSVEPTRPSTAKPLSRFRFRESDRTGEGRAIDKSVTWRGEDAIRRKREEVFVEANKKPKRVYGSSPTLLRCSGHVPAKSPSSGARISKQAKDSSRYLKSSASRFGDDNARLIVHRCRASVISVAATAAKRNYSGSRALHRPQLRKPDVVDHLFPSVRGFRGGDYHAVEEFAGNMLPATRLDEVDFWKLGLHIENHMLERLVHETIVELISCPTKQ